MQLGSKNTFITSKYDFRNGGYFEELRKTTMPYTCKCKSAMLIAMRMKEKLLNS